MTRSTDQEHVIELRDAARAALDAGREDAARATYAEATRLACEVLAPTDPVRIAVAGAHAEVWFERWNDAGTALEIAGEAYDEAVEAIDGALGEEYRLTVRELSDLRDRMTFWAFTLTVS